MYPVCRTTVKEVDMEQGRYSQRGALFAHQIFELGEDGFAKWLVDSFAGQQVNPVLGYFHDDELSFDQVFDMIFREFESKVMDIIRSALVKASSQFGPQTSEEGKQVFARLLMRVA
jgi:hypothetical protein